MGRTLADDPLFALRFRESLSLNIECWEQSRSCDEIRLLLTRASGTLLGLMKLKNCRYTISRYYYRLFFYEKKKEKSYTSVVLAISELFGL